MRREQNRATAGVPLFRDEKLVALVGVDDVRKIHAWTPEEMPEGYRVVIKENPFFAVDITNVGLVATGYLDVSAGSVEAIFTLPDFTGKGLASQIITAIKNEARSRGFKQLTLCATPNAQTFYERHGFHFIQQNISPSRLIPEGLPCIDMAINL